MWLKEGAPLNDSFKRTSENEYYASVFRVDFGNPDLPAIIRQWIGWQTDQAISMDVATASGESMKLVNAVNYQAQWTGGFRTEDNITDVFHSADGQDITWPVYDRTLERHLLPGPGVPARITLTYG